MCKHVADTRLCTASLATGAAARKHLPSYLSYLVILLRFSLEEIASSSATKLSPCEYLCEPLVGGYTFSLEQMNLNLLCLRFSTNQRI